MEKLLGGKLYRANSIVELATVEREFYENQTGGEFRRTGHSLSVCECCGFREKNGSPETCVCAGTEWYMLPDGRVECLPHRTARAINGSRKWWDFRR